MKNIFLILFLITSCVNAQEVLYYKESGKRTVKDSAYCYCFNTKNEPEGIRCFYRMNGRRYKDMAYGLYDQKVRKGLVVYYNDNGTTKSESMFEHETMIWHKQYHPYGDLFYTCRYKDGIMDDTLKSYYEDGTLKRIDIWKYGKFVSGKVMKKDGTDTTYYHFEELAVYPGGREALKDFLAHQAITPPKLAAKGIKGEVLVQFMIDENGQVQNIEILKSVNSLLNPYAIEAISKLHTFEAGRMDGKPTKTTMSLTIKFK